MKAQDEFFTKIIDGTTQFVIPVFQRDYRWTEDQCFQLWQDVLDVAQKEGDPKHFLGSVVYISTGDSSAGFTRWLLIDGQQRLTTLTLILLALRDHISETGWEGDESAPTSDRIDAYFLKNLHESGSRVHKLMLRNSDQGTLQSLIDKTDLPDKPSARIIENYDLFKEYIQTENPSLVYKGIGRLVVVDVTLHRGLDDPQLIFESLNSTGIDLSQSDLIRNYILMGLDEEEQTKFYDQYWSKIENVFRGAENTFDAFARDYIALKTQASRQEKAGEIYRAFRHELPNLKEQLFGLENVLGDMVRFAKYHAAFSLKQNKNFSFGVALTRLGRLIDVPTVFIMHLFDCFDRMDVLSEEEFQEAVELLESYILRRAICGLQTRGYWQVFANLAYKLDDDDPLTSLKVELSRMRESYRFPSDTEFRQALLTQDIYGLRLCLFLLERIENYDTNEPTDTTEYTIEHIMPQNEKLLPAWQRMLGDDWQEIQKTWLHRIGNLTLTGYNSRYSDRPFEEKKTIEGGFEESSVRLNKFVREQPFWTDVEMKLRTEKLTSEAMIIWPALQVDPALIQQAEERDMRELAKRRDVNKVSMSQKARELFDSLRLQVLELADDIIELAETKSVSYHGPAFFAEILPRTHNITILLPLDYSEIEDPGGIAEDATQWKFFFYAQHEGGVALSVSRIEDVEPALLIIRKAFNLSSS